MCLCRQAVEVDTGQWSVMLRSQKGTAGPKECSGSLPPCIWLIIITIIIHGTIFIVLSSTAGSHMREFTLALLSESRSAPGGCQLVGQAARVILGGAIMWLYSRSSALAARVIATLRMSFTDSFVKVAPTRDLCAIWHAVIVAEGVWIGPERGETACAQLGNGARVGASERDGAQAAAEQRRWASVASRSAA